MPKAAVAPKVEAVKPEVIKQEGLQIIEPLSMVVDTLTVETEEDYLQADGLLSRIRKARGTWGERMEKIIRPIRQGLDELYSLNRTVDKPLEALENSVKGKMKEFKLEEARQLREAERLKEQEQKRLQEEADRKAREAEAARTAQMRGKLQAQAQRLQQQAETVAQQEAPQAVRGESSTTRPVKKVRVINLIHFLQGIVDGYVPEECIAVVQVKLNQHLKDDPIGMEAWPGVEVYDDIQIVGR